jgi:uncharacterized Zn finger protein
MLTQSILAKIEGSRLQKAVDGLISGAYTINVTGQSDTEVSGFVTNGEGPQYGVVLTEGRAFCSCPDAMFRHTICKHAAVLALHVIRTPEPVVEKETEEVATLNLKLVKTRKGYVFSA